MTEKVRPWRAEKIGAVAWAEKEGAAAWAEKWALGRKRRALKQNASKRNA
jgi:hypothetical protein